MFLYVLCEAFLCASTHFYNPIAVKPIGTGTYQSTDGLTSIFPQTVNERNSLPAVFDFLDNFGDNELILQNC
jgi:hypothetical protein